jgi:hypothetical protein
MIACIHDETLSQPLIAKIRKKSIYSFYCIASEIDVETPVVKLATVSTFVSGPTILYLTL